MTNLLIDCLNIITFLYPQLQDLYKAFYIMKGKKDVLISTSSNQTICNSQSSFLNSSSSSFGSPPPLSSSSSSINQPRYIQEERAQYQESKTFLGTVSNAVMGFASAISGITAGTRPKDMSIGGSNYVEEKNNSSIDSKLNSNSILFKRNSPSSHEVCYDNESNNNSSFSNKNTRRRDQEDGYRSGGDEEPDSAVTADRAIRFREIERKGNGYTISTSDTIELCSSDDDIDRAADVKRSSEHDSDNGIRTKMCAKQERGVLRSFQPILCNTMIPKDNRNLSSEIETQPLNDDDPLFRCLKDVEERMGNGTELESKDKKSSHSPVEKNKDENRLIEHMTIPKDNVVKGFVSARKAVEEDTLDGNGDGDDSGDDICIIVQEPSKFNSGSRAVNKDGRREDDGCRDTGMEKGPQISGNGRGNGGASGSGGGSRFAEVNRDTMNDVFYLNERDVPTGRSYRHGHIDDSCRYQNNISDNASSSSNSNYAGNSNSNYDNSVSISNRNVCSLQTASSSSSSSSSSISGIREILDRAKGSNKVNHERRGTEVDLRLLKRGNHPCDKRKSVESSDDDYIDGEEEMDNFDGDETADEKTFENDDDDDDDDDDFIDDSEVKKKKSKKTPKKGVAKGDDSRPKKRGKKEGVGKLIEGPIDLT